MPGKVLSSKKREGNANRCYRYHILFDNGDQDAQLFDADVVEEGMYAQLLRETTERRRKKSRLSGIDLITAASKVSSPIKSHPKQNEISVSARRKLYSDDAHPFRDDALPCVEKLVSDPPDPARCAHTSSTPSPKVYSGVYTKTNTSKCDRDNSSVPSLSSKLNTYAISKEWSDAPDDLVFSPAHVPSTVDGMSMPNVTSQDATLFMVAN